MFGNLDSFIIPVFNRPQEIKELLDSFVGLNTNLDYEIVIVEDGSTKTCKDNFVQQPFQASLLVSFIHSLRNIPHIVVDFSRWGSQNQIANGIASHS